MSTVPSTTIVTNLKNISAPTANTLAGANSHGIGISSMLALALSKAYELKSCVALIAAQTDGADPNLSTLNDVLASLS